MFPATNMKKIFNIFVSYSSRDEVFVSKLVSDLRTYNLNIWIDKEQIDGGDSVPSKVSEGLSTCNFFFIILSKNSVKSRWVKKELDTATMKEIDKNRPKIIPVLIETCDIPELLISKRYVDFRYSYSSGIINLLDSIYETEQATRAENSLFLPLPHNRHFQSEDTQHYASSYSSEKCALLLAPDGVTLVRVIVLLKSTGERIPVCLPQDIRCDFAARRIVGEIFLKDLPTYRRDVYLLNLKYSLCRGSKTFDNQTLKEAGINNGDEVSIISSPMKQYFHYERTFEQERISKEIRESDPINGIFDCICKMLLIRVPYPDI